MRTNQTTCLGMRQQEQKSEWRHGYDQNNKVNQFKIISAYIIVVKMLNSRPRFIR